MPNDFDHGRSGWNRRGPSDREIMDAIRDESEKSDPDSYYWQNMTYNIKFALVSRMGGEEFVAFAELLFPGETIYHSTWQQIYDAYAAKLEQVQGMEAETERHDADDNPRHYKTNGVY